MQGSKQSHVEESVMVTQVHKYLFSQFVCGLMMLYNFILNSSMVYNLPFPTNHLNSLYHLLTSLIDHLVPWEDHLMDDCLSSDTMHYDNFHFFICLVTKPWGPSYLRSLYSSQESISHPNGLLALFPRKTKMVVCTTNLLASVALSLSPHD